MKKSVLAWLFIGCIWQILAMLINNTLLMPFPADVFLKMLQQANDPNFWMALGQTFFRIFSAFIIALILSIMLVVLKQFKGLHSMIIDYCLLVLRVVPTAAIILIALVWLNPNKSILLITLLVMLPLMVDLLWEQFRTIKKDYRDPLLMYGSSTFENVTKILIPLSLSSFLTLCKSGFLLGLKVVISSEVLVSIQTGLGRQLQYARFDLDMNRLFAITLWVILIAFLISKIFDALIDKVRY